MVWALAILAFIAIGGFLYWHLIIAEGAYLGRRVVVFLYNLFANSYDQVKGFDPGYEQWFLGLPISKALSALPDPFILDVACGTGRLGRTLLAQTGFRGRIVGLDLSRNMLSQAVETMQAWRDRVLLLHQDATYLPFPDKTFDAVTCMEALEFMPEPPGVLNEMLRVLRPGGLLIISNRIGKEAHFLPGRAYAPDEFEALLQSVGIEMVRTQPWQEDYDLVWGVKSGVMGPVSMRRFFDILRCPQCQSPLEHKDQFVICSNGHRYPIANDGVIELV